MHLWNKLQRLLRHRWLDDSDAHRALGSAGLARITERVALSEQHHSGEIRVCVEASLPLGDVWQGTTPRQRALAMFGHLRVWDTEANNGVLVYLLLADHAIELVADRALARCVPESEWQAMVTALRSDLQQGAFEAGLLAAVDRLDGLLRQHFPLAPGARNPNELSDHPALH